MFPTIILMQSGLIRFFLFFFVVFIFFIIPQKAAVFIGF